MAEQPDAMDRGGERVPRDMQDQQARPGEDPWEVSATNRPDDSDDDDDEDVPDTDEAGTGRQGAPHAATVNPEHPTPDESPA
ncbi:hypothetical protein [Streptomyces sp. NPDC018693]|uniref:hypothetical protein n=1 Tax=unclassified Streptomyces TaxID=2593676 RepID=UPI0037B8E26F